MDSGVDVLKQAMENKPRPAKVPNPVPVETPPQETPKKARRGRPENPANLVIEAVFEERKRHEKDDPCAIVTGKNTRKDTKPFTVYLPNQLAERLGNECSNVSGTITGLIQYVVDRLDAEKKTVKIKYQRN